jgi:1-acyl-sn-glycerol-3-phosphate acyltransferase
MDSGEIFRVVMENTLSKRNQNSDWREQVPWFIYEKNLVKAVKKFGRVIFWPIIDPIFIGFENIPPEGACILTPNHISNVDPVLVGLYTPRHAFFMAKSEIFRNSFMRWFVRQWGAFPVDRGQRDAWALQQAGRVLEAGQMLCMFPEGTRSKHGAKLGKGKPGTAKLALEYHAPILPTAIWGTHLVRPGLKRYQVTVQVSEPLDLVALAGPPPYDYEVFEAMTTIIMKRIAAMLPAGHRGIYA